MADLKTSQTRRFRGKFAKHGSKKNNSFRNILSYNSANAAETSSAEMSVTDILRNVYIDHTYASTTSTSKTCDDSSDKNPTGPNKEANKDYFTGSRQLRMNSAGNRPTPIEGYRIIDLNILAYQLQDGCTVCREMLSLTNLLYGNRQGLASLLYIQCERCGNLNKVATCKGQRKAESKSIVYDVNRRAGVGMCFKTIFFKNLFLCFVHSASVTSYKWYQVSLEVKMAAKHLGLQFI